MLLILAVICVLIKKSLELNMMLTGNIFMNEIYIADDSIDIISDTEN